MTVKKALRCMAPSTLAPSLRCGLARGHSGYHAAQVQELRWPQAIPPKASPRARRGGKGGR
jgi:hypothetical protein